jgi:hypothetical protein
MKKNISVVTFFLFVSLFNSNKILAQYFEGKLQYANYYLDKNTFKQFSAKLEWVYIKGNYQKTQLIDTGQGSLDWELLDFKNSQVYYRKIYKDAPILHGSLCATKSNDSAVTFDLLDTTYVISGLTSKVMIKYVGDKKMAEYYYYDSIRINPIHFKCHIENDLDLFYNKTNGALITQIVDYGGSYVYIYQLKEIDKGIVDDSEFVLPKDIRIIEEKKE